MDRIRLEQEDSRGVGVLALWHKSRGIRRMAGCGTVKQEDGRVLGGGTLTQEQEDAMVREGSTLAQEPGDDRV